MKTCSLLLSSGVRAVALAIALSPLCPAAQTYTDAEAGSHLGDEATVTGKVASVSKSGKGTVYVNFGAKFPQQTFAGVVFARDAEKVGDLAQFAGKTVALTGRIEMSPDGKPQIIIKAADQLKLADETSPATPPPPPAEPVPSAPPTVSAPTTAPATVAAPKPTPPPRDDQKRIELAANWITAPQTGDMARKDLAMLFGSSVASGRLRVPDDSIVVYPDVPYLAPLAAARRTLHLENTNASRIKITTPGLPVGSLTANVFPGVFPGGYTTLTLVTDVSDQIVSVHLTDTNPRIRTADLTDKGGYHIYNFIAQREKSASQLVIRHDIVTEGAPAGVVVVDSMLIDPGAADPNAPARTPARSSRSSSASRPRTGKVLERSRWYVPQPLVKVILRASGNR